MGLNKYLSLAVLEFKTSLAYKWQFLSSIIISPLMLFLQYFLWNAVYSNNSSATIMGYSLQDMITYFVASMLVGHFIYNMVGNELQEKILYGDLNQDLLKPVSVFMQMLSRTIGDRGFAFIVEVIPVFVIAFIMFNLKIPNLLFIVLAAISLMLAFFLNFIINYLIGILAFWISKIDSVQWLLFFSVRFFSGEFLPLTFFGPIFFTISKFLPFYYVRYGVIQIFIGSFTIVESLELIFIQLVWIILLYFIIRFIWNIAMKHYGAMGG